MIKIATFLFCLTLIASCSNEFQKKNNFDLIKPVIQNTKWTNTPMPEFSECVDSLIFHSNEGVAYSCEHESKSEFYFKVYDDTLYLERMGYKSELDTVLEVRSKEWYLISEKELVWVKVLRKEGENWKELKKKYLNQFYYKQVKSINAL